MTKLRPHIGVKPCSNEQLNLEFPLDSLLLAPLRYFTTPPPPPVSVVSRIHISIGDLAGLHSFRELLLRPSHLVRIAQRGANEGGEIRLTFQYNYEADDEDEEGVEFEREDEADDDEEPAEEDEGDESEE